MRQNEKKLYTWPPFYCNSAALKTVEHSVFAKLKGGNVAVIGSGVCSNIVLLLFAVVNLSLLLLEFCMIEMQRLILTPNLFKLRIMKWKSGHE